MAEKAAEGDSCSDVGTGTYLCTMKMSGGWTQYRITEDCPLLRVMAQIPLTYGIFISGSAATWMAERSLSHSVPDWNPNDIDVFACLPTTEFNIMVDRYVHMLSTHCEATVQRRCSSVVDVAFANCPYTQSFIRCPPLSSADDIVQNFDINICTPIIVTEDKALWVKMKNDVASSIRDRRMRCVVRKRNPEYLSYPFTKTLHRLRKYVARGYGFASLTFESTTHLDFPELAENSTLNVDDFDMECVMSRLKRIRPN